MTTALEHAHQSGCTVALDVMSKDKAAIRLYERLGADCIGKVVHHHNDGLTEPAVVFGFPRSGSE
ncbi:hypothetical protein SAMN05216207_1001195 [Pseudonocardia ammonioxydans]|uniref:N-acetyltransferase domain-containing protein n=1 Tax=Pseudonocardia ammonioxydans TaxID=260086 RepID=A0A1I4S1Q2_PSUAM|nr:hypothetical protein SAMN05216207_1001195 [Pseudonocardia ammonioxydans]